MRILIACEFSGVVREAFKAKGHDAWSCDLLPTDIPGQHIQGDVLEVLNDGWDMLIAHDPCTYQCNSGVRWLHTQLGRWDKLRESCIFTKKLLEADIPKKVRENPIPHKYALELIGRKYDQIIQPSMFGHFESKATCLWIEGLPKLVVTNDVTEEMKALPKSITQRIHRIPPGPDRWKIRSTTFSGIADAFADQWGDL